MATFEAQVEGLTSLSIDGSSAPTQTELTQFLTDGAKEIINILPPNLLDWCASQQTFTSVMPGSEAETMNTGKVLRVYRSDGDFDRVCRRIRADEKGYANDPDEMGYASSSDPVFYTENNKLNALPQGGSCKYDEVQYPAVAYGDSAISVFPDEAEYLVSLYGAIKSLQNVLGDKSSNSDITTALTAINAEIDECLSIADNVHTEIALINTQSDSAVAEIVLANVEVDKMAAEVGLDNAELDKATAELGEAVTLVDSGIDTATAAIATAAGRINTAVVLANGQFDAGVLEAAQAEGEADDSAIATALTAINTNVDSAVAEIVLANAEVDEIVSQTDNSSDFATALTAINTELDKVDEICSEANTEFDKCDALLSLGEADSEGAVNTSLGKFITELDETQAVCDLINTQVDAAVVELAESASLVDSNIDTAVAAITTALGRVNTAVALANTEFDLVNPEVDLANAQVDAEDIELANDIYLQLKDMLMLVLNILVRLKLHYQKLRDMLVKYQLELVM